MSGIYPRDQKTPELQEAYDAGYSAGYKQGLENGKEYSTRLAYERGLQEGFAERDASAGYDSRWADGVGV